MTIELSRSGLGFDFDNSRALLIGASRFPRDMENLPNLPAVTANVIDFERHLRDPSVVGLSPERVQRMLDEEDISLVAERVAEVSRDAEDLFFAVLRGAWTNLKDWGTASHPEKFNSCIGRRQLPTLEHC